MAIATTPIGMCVSALFLLGLRGWGVAWVFDLEGQIGIIWGGHLEGQNGSKMGVS